MQIKLKKALALCLSVFLIISIFPLQGLASRVVVDSGNCGTNVTWTYYSDGELLIEGEGDMNGYHYNPLYNTAPWRNFNVQKATIHEGVSSIGSNAFYGCTSLESILIPDTVTKIGDKAFFNCSSLTSIDIPDVVTSIEEYAFYGCTSLESILIPDNITAIYRCTFYHCSSLTSIIIPDGVESIGSHAFADCLSLTSVDIPESVTFIGLSAFEKCISLKSIDIPEYVTEIGEDAFTGCYSLAYINVSKNNEKFSSLDGVLFNKLNTILIEYPGAKLDDCYTIPNSVNIISVKAFYNSMYLKFIIIPDTISYITKDTFKNIYNLTIYGNENSYAQDYAKKNSIPFKIYGVDHNFIDCNIIKAASCTEKGEKECICNICGAKEKQEIPAIGSHTWGEWKVETPATTEQAGKEKRICSICGQTESREIPKIEAEKISLKKSDKIKLINTKDLSQGLLIKNTLTAKEIKALTENKNLSIQDKDGKEIKDGELVGSGATINLVKDGKVIDKYTIVVLGDTNGDAKVTAADARFALRMSAKLENPKAWQFEAAARVNDINAKPEKITAAMARKILRVSAKLEKF